MWSIKANAAVKIINFNVTRKINANDLCTSKTNISRGNIYLCSSILFVRFLPYFRGTFPVNGEFYYCSDLFVFDPMRSCLLWNEMVVFCADNGINKLGEIFEVLGVQYIGEVYNKERMEEVGLVLSWWNYPFRFCRNR